MTNDPFGPKGFDTIREFMRQRNLVEQAAFGTFGQAATIKHMIEQIDGSAGILSQLKRDPIQESLSELRKRLRDEDGIRSTARAIHEAQCNRELALKSLGSADLLRQRDLALTAYASGIKRTAEAFARNRDMFASTLSASRSLEDITGLASSVVRRMESLRLSAQLAPNWSKSLADQYIEQLGIARRVAEDLEAAETEEQRTALLTTLLMTLITIMRGFAGNTKNQLIGIGAFALLGFVADVVSLLPEDPIGLPPAQVQMIEDTREEVRALREEHKAYRQSEDKLDEQWVADLPRAELMRNAMVREGVGKHERVLAKLKAEAPLAIAGSEGAWKHVVYRDPLTDELAQGWVYGPLVRLLD